MQPGLWDYSAGFRPRSFFSSGGFVDGTDEADNGSGQYKSPGLTRNGTRPELLSSEGTRDKLAMVPVVTLEIMADEA